MEKQGKHANYEILNLIGYGLAKFDMDFIKHFGLKTKIAFYQYIVQKGIAETDKEISPILKSKFKQLQVTGREAELFFMNNYKKIEFFKDGYLEDARIFGDGYDFQIEVIKHFFLVEIKGLRSVYGSIRMTQNEFEKAKEFKNDYALVVISNLSDIPKTNLIFNPTDNMKFTEKTVNSNQVSYHTNPIKWQ